MSVEKMVSLVIPIHNEEAVIPELHRRVTAALDAIDHVFEVIIIDDGSTDGSLHLLKGIHDQDPRWKILSFSRNFGHQAAVLAGLTESKGEYIGIIDGDLQDPPELMAAFKAKIDEGYGVVFGVRKKRKEVWWKKMAYSVYYKILKNVSQIEIPLDSGDFSMIGRQALNDILKLKEQSLFIRGIRSWVGYKQYGYEYERDKRFGGEPKYTLKKLFLLAYNGIFSFSTLPVKLLTRIGMLMILSSVLYTMYALYIKFTHPDTPQGFTTLAVAIFLFSGVQLLSLGVIGEYVIRIYDETRGRPIYLVKDKWI